MFVHAEDKEVVQTALPSGYFRLPNGLIMGPGGVMVSEQDLIEAEVAEQQALTPVASGCYELPNGTSINAYGQVCL